MLSFLLDEHISPDVATIVTKLRPEVPVVALVDWQDGVWMGRSDEEILRAAHSAGLTLLTYDQRTIPQLLSRWARTEEPHCGVVFIDERTIAPNDLAALSRSLVVLWDAHRDWNWSNRLSFLGRSS